MIYLMMFLLEAGPAVGGVAGGSTVLGFGAWIVKRHLKKKDERRKAYMAKLEQICSNTHRTVTDVEVIKSRLDSGDQRMQRIEANVDDIREDMRTVKRRQTDKINGK
jgi:hypothetical protein